MRTIVVLLGLVLACSPARAVEDAERAAARATIERQIDAFRRKDTAAAYAQAAPQIQAMFTSPETFLAMVEQGYGAILHARSYSFDAERDEGDGALAQGVRLQDEGGVDWEAIYTLHRQDDGQWRITGCTLRKAPGNNT